MNIASVAENNHFVGFEITFPGQDEYKKVLEHCALLRLFCGHAYVRNELNQQVIFDRISVFEEFCRSFVKQPDGSLRLFLPPDRLDEFFALFFIVTGCFAELFKTHLELVDSLAALKNSFDIFDDTVKRVFSDTDPGSVVAE